MANIYDYSVPKTDGSEQSLKDFEGKVMLIVNTATGCGFTPHYEPMEKMYEEYHDKGFEIIDVPCNQFRDQAPGTDEEIAAFCDAKFGITFPQFSKIEVNGANEHPLYAFLKSQKGFQGFGKGNPLAVLLKVKLK